VDPATGDAFEDDGEWRFEGDDEIDWDEIVELVGLRCSAWKAVEDERSGRIVGGLREWRGLRGGGLLDEGVGVEVLGGCGSGCGGESHGFRAVGWEEPASSLELVEDEPEDHGVWDESSGFHSAFGFDAERCLILDIVAQ